MAFWQDRNYLRATGAAVVLAMSIGMAAAEESALLAPGVAAYQSGKTDQAIKALSGVLTGGTASGTDVARAYYFRGLAYSKSGKPAQAIADLNNALWLKGLATDEQANAYLARGKAYQATGLDSRAAQDFRAAEKLLPGAAGQELAAVQVAQTEVPAAGVELQNNQAPAVETATEAPAASGSAALVLAPSTVQTAAKKKSTNATSTATVGGTATATAGATTDTAGTLRERSGTVSRTSSSEALSTATVPSGNGSIFSGGGDFFSNLFSSDSSNEPAVTESTSAPAVEAAPAKRKATLARGEGADFSTTSVTEAPAATVVASNEAALPAVTATATDTPLVLAPATTGSAAEATAAEASFVAETSAADPQVSSWSSEAVDEQASFTATTDAAPAPTGGSDTLADVGTSVGSFFEGLFSGNQPADATGSAIQAAPQPAAQEVQVAAIEPAAQPVNEATPAGRYRAQIATVRSPEEAQIIARRMQTERKALLGDRRADVEPVVLGNMGTFYAVMVGPFADERASEKFCGKLQGEGFDCFVAEP